MKRTLACLVLLAPFALYGQQGEDVLMWTRDSVVCRNPMPDQPELYRWMGDWLDQELSESRNRAFRQLATHLCGHDDAAAYIDNLNGLMRPLPGYQLTRVTNVGYLTFENDNVSSWTRNTLTCRNPMPGQPGEYLWRYISDEDLWENHEYSMINARSDVMRLFRYVATSLCGSVDASEWMADFDLMGLTIKGNVGYLYFQAVPQETSYE